MNLYKIIIPHVYFQLTYFVIADSINSAIKKVINRVNNDGEQINESYIETIVLICEEELLIA